MISPLTEDDLHDGWNGSQAGKVFRESDIRAAVEELIDVLRSMPNRDDRLAAFRGGVNVALLDGGGIGKFDAMQVVKDAFPVFYSSSALETSEVASRKAGTISGEAGEISGDGLRNSLPTSQATEKGAGGSPALRFTEDNMKTAEIAAYEAGYRSALAAKNPVVDGVERHATSSSQLSEHRTSVADGGLSPQVGSVRVGCASELSPTSNYKDVKQAPGNGLCKCGHGVGHHRRYKYSQRCDTCECPLYDEAVWK